MEISADCTDLAVITSSGAEAPCGVTARECWSCPAGPHAQRTVAGSEPAGRRVGVEIARAGAVSPVSERHFLSADEREALAFIDATTLWSMKEAAWKALGCSDAAQITLLELRFDANRSLEAVLLGGSRCPAQAKISTLGAGYVLVVVWLEAEV